MAVLGNPEDGADMLREGRLAPAGLLDRDPLAGDSRFGAALGETRLPGQVFLGDRYEVATGVLDGGLRDAPEDAALLHALDRGGRVVDAVASAGVKQAVGTSGRARAQVPLFDQHRIDAAQRQVAERPCAR